MIQPGIDDLILLLRKIVAEEVKLSIDKIDPDLPMGAFGLDSINSIYVLEFLENKLKVELNPLMFYDHPTIRKFCTHIHGIITGNG